PGGLPDYIASGNGRIEATEIDIATKSGGRLLEVMVREGELVEAGQVLARVDTQSLRASLLEAQAQVRQAQHAELAAQAMVSQRESEKAAASAVVAQRQTELMSAPNRYKRSHTMAQRGSIPTQQLEDDQAAMEGAEAALNAAKAQVASVDAAIAAARAQVVQAQSLIKAAEATVARLQVEIEDADLKAPRAGRVQYRVAEPGEVLGAGGRVLNMIDISDVYMTFYLPTAAAGRVALGTDVRLVLDAAPDVVIPAKISFVASTAQFTPKTVETENERLKLMFRVKASIDPQLLKKYAQQVKTGLPGMAYVRLDDSREWPPELQMKQVQRRESRHERRRCGGGPAGDPAGRRRSALREQAGIAGNFPGDPGPSYGGPDRAGWGRQVQPVVPDQWRPGNPAGADRGTRRGYGRCPSSSHHRPPYRLYAPGAGQEPVSHPVGGRKPGLLCPPVRPRPTGTGAAHGRAAGGDGPVALQGPSGGQALRRHEAEAGALLRPDPSPGPAGAGRAHHRRRSPVPRTVLGADRAGTQPSPGHECGDRHRLYGRSRRLRLAGRHG